MSLPALFQWGAAACIAIVPSMLAASLRAPHLPAQPAVLEQSSNVARQWQIFHVLSDGCACSNRIRAYLRQRPGIHGVRERMIPVDGGRHLRLANLDLDSSSAPLLIVVSPDGRVRYAGGYSQRADAQDGFHDQEIVSLLSRGVTVEALPVYRCNQSHLPPARLGALGLKALLHQ